MKYKIPFNKPFIVDKELMYILEAVSTGQLAGNGVFTKKCEDFLEQRCGYRKVFMTHSGTGALEMAAILCNIKTGDEVILPSYTFVSTANAFYLYGAVLKFVDIRPDTLNIDDNLIEKAITNKTKVICPVHYAGIGCEMNNIVNIAKKYKLRIVEDAAHAINSQYNDKYLGSLGDLSALSFHETKNFISGEGGALIVNDSDLIERAEIIWEKGTNRKKFFQGKVDKYTWVDVGSSFYPSELVSAFLFAQLEKNELIMKKRLSLWEYYWDNLFKMQDDGLFKLPVIPENCKHNAHMFYLLLNSEAERNELLARLRENHIHAVFHYIPLHSSPMGVKMGYKPSDLPVTEDISRRILRLPLFFELKREEQDLIINVIRRFFIKGIYKEIFQ